MTKEHGQSGSVRRPYPVGGTWSPEPRPCAVCGDKHKHLSALSDGRHVCIGCAFDVKLGEAA